MKEGQKYLMATNNKSGVTLSVTLERVSGQANMEECRSSLQKRTTGDGSFKITDVRTRDVGGVPVVEFLIPEAQGVKLQRGTFSLAWPTRMSTLMSISQRCNFSPKMKPCLKRR